MAYSYPTILYPNTMTSGQKLFRDTSMGYSTPLGKEIYYTVKSGDVGDITCYAFVSGRPVTSIPTANDDVYIRHTMTHNTNVAFTTFNLFISPTGSFQVTGPNRTVNIFGNIQSLGTLNLANQNCQIFLYGSDNYIDTVVSSSETRFNYFGGSVIPQPIMTNFSYNNLTIGNAGTKYLTGNLIVNNPFIIGNFVAGCIFDAGFYDITSNSTTTFQGGATCFKSGGNWLFVGACSFSSGTWDFSRGANTMEFRAGWATGGGAVTTVNSGSVWTYTTNNQTITVGSTITLSQTNIVSGAITISASVSGNILFLSGTFNGTVAGSTLLMLSSSFLTFLNDAAANCMSTGVFDTYTNANTITYNYAGTGTVRQTSFSVLTISGTGTKTLIGNTSLSGNLIINSSGTLQLSTYNLSVIGTSSVTSTCQLLKSGTGSVLFTGLFTGGDNSITNLAAATSIEFRGGITTTFNSQILTGTIQITLSANQTINIGGQTVIFHDVLISGAVTVINVSNIATGVIQINNTLNGNNVASTWDNRGILNINTTSTLMSTGVIIWDVNTNSTMVYMMSGNYTLPYTSYQNLTAAGGSTKTLSGNTTVRNLSTLGATTIQADVYNLTINGTTLIRNPGLLLKSGAGTVIFVGAVTLNDSTTINFSTGNPSVEMRSGISGSFASIANFGSGQLAFTTNSQSINNLGGATWTIGSVLISGAITVTYAGASIINNTLNGNNAASTWLMGASSNINYGSATQPMATGILNTSTNLNTFIYGNGNQDVKGGTYRNLTLNGGGVKTLQGNTSVLNTYTLTAPATKNNNGFTFGNP